MDSELAELSQRPLELLAALEQRLDSVSGQASGFGERAWRGLGFTLGGGRYLVAPAEVREVVALPALTRVPGAREWLLGVANVRGELMPITDLAAILGLASAPGRDGAQVIVLDDPDVPAGFLVDRVAGFREFPHEARGQAVPDDTIPEAAHPFLLGGFEADDGIWQLISLRKLAADSRFREAGGGASAG